MVQRRAWYELPAELAERILAFLPVTAVFRCRCVCKQWNSLLRSRSFFDLWTKTSPRNPWFLIYKSQCGLAAFSPRAHCWNILPLHGSLSLNPSEAIVLASSGGLLCLQNRNSDHPALVVYNPVTSSTRALPLMSEICYIDVVGMITDKMSDSYKILVTGTTEPASGESITELYDSRTGKWAHQCRSYQDFLQFWYVAHAVWHEGLFYCLASHVSKSRSCRLIAYDLENHKWGDFEVEMPSGDLRCLSLVLCGGRFFLTGKIVESHSTRSICIWELKWESLKWIEVGAMPSDILSRLHARHSILIHCQGYGDLLCFTTYRGWQSIIYSLSGRTWTMVQENSVYGGSQSQAIGGSGLVGLPYEPSFTARA